MTTVAYSDVLGRINALCGVLSPTTDIQTATLSFVNRRANMAYKACDFWPRYLVAGESRTVTNNVIPYSELGKNNIDTFLRIHKAYVPFYQYSSVELEFYVDGDGAHVVNDSTSASTTYVTYKKVWEGPYNTSSNIPEEWYDYICQAVYADRLRSDGKNEIAVAEERAADDILQQRLTRTDVVRSVGMIAHRISTHVNRAYRRN